MQRRSLIALPPALLLSACAAPGSPPAPQIISSAEWGAAPPSANPTPHRIEHITLHHQGETWVPGKDAAAYLRRLQTWSRETKHWADIPYHYVISPEGLTYAARPENQPGDTNTEYNPRGHALVMLLGNFEEVEPTTAALGSCAEVMAWIALRHHLGVETIASHKDHSKQTVCPGAHLYRYLQNGWLKRAVAERMAGRALPAV
ncbi:MAG TPA: peptidoglycan recognition family protein [Burkholderiaceae bacterium]